MAKRRTRAKTKLKRKIAKATGIPTTKSGRKQKARRMMTGGGCLIPAALICACIATALSFIL